MRNVWLWIVGIAVGALVLTLTLSMQAYYWFNGKNDKHFRQEQEQALKFTTGAVIVEWNANSEPDLAGYKIYYSKKSGDYADVVDVGNVTERYLGGLATQQQWYFAATAYDLTGNESDFSKEVSIYLSGDDTNAVRVNFEFYNFPNPFNPASQSTYIRFYLAEAQLTSITIYSGTEQLVRRLLVNEMCLPGEHLEEWDGRNDAGQIVANGVYYAVVVLGVVKRVVQVVVVG